MGIFIQFPGKKIFFVQIIIFVIISLAGCAKKIMFTGSHVVPAAEGVVKIKKDNNRNYRIDISIKNLADPKKLYPPKDLYVAWMETERNGIKNIGQLKTSSGLLSNALKSSLQSVSPFKPVRIFITAENEAAIQYPGSQQVLTTRTF